MDPHTLTEALNRLSPAKRALLEIRLKKQGFSVSGSQNIIRRGERHFAPLSFSQQRLWFLDQYAPNTSVYNLPSARRLRGTLRVDALERSLNEIIRRHESLRTTFSMVEGEPVQIIAPSHRIGLDVVDLTGCPEDEKEEQAQRLASEEARRSFDLAHGPLFRGKLLRLGEQDHVLLLTMHHIVSDGWSMEVLYSELSTLYRAFLNGETSPLPELPIQYTDFAVWQREWLRGEVLETQLAYWKKQLADIPEVLNLPTDRPRPAVQTHRGARHSFALTQQLTEQLMSLSRKQGATLFMTLLAALQVLLYRHTGQEDIVVGSPIANRNRAEIEGLIGFFVNTLALRTSLSGTPAFSELLGRVRETALAAYAHQDVPFEKLLEELHPQRDPSRTPLFQVFFNMMHAERSVAEMAGLKMEVLAASATVDSKFDLTIYAREKHGFLQFDWVYNADLFDDTRIRELLKQYELLLSQIVENPDREISGFSLVTSEAEKLIPNPAESLAADWVGSVHERLSYQAARLPDHLALTDTHVRWSYSELNSRTNQLAHYLVASGIQREEVVAIYAHRSAALVWALMGTLKAGAAFLILDPAYPAARLMSYVRAAKPRAFIQLEAAGAIPTELESLIETNLRCRISLPGGSRVQLTELLQRYSEEDPNVSVGPDDLACVCFTSGSTGEPKGILGRHGPLSHFLPWQAENFSLSSSDRFSVLAGLSHDPLQREIFTALWVGGLICIPDPDLIMAPGELAGWMAQKEITFTHLTPALGRIITETANPSHGLPLLRYAFFVGDKLTWKDVASLRGIAPNVACVNYYGSTETQRAVSYYEIPAGMKKPEDERVVPVGRGMPNVQLLVLTPETKLAGLGEVGELYIRSPHLGRGYLGDAAFTQKLFITNPFTGDTQDRLYRTGDFGRYLLDGNIELLGRRDGQVKIRGFRIELGEIEFVLRQHPAVRGAVVVAREENELSNSNTCTELSQTMTNPKSDKRLVAYVVAGNDSALSAHDLRSHLRQKLPAYMIPSFFVLLDSLPLNANGKIDRNALPLPQPGALQSEDSYVVPRTPTEATIAEIWKDLLRVDRVGIHDNFFDLGGHSLLATRAISRVGQALQVELPVRSLFEAPTVAALAELIQTVRWSRQAQRTPIGSRVPREQGDF